MATFTMAIKDSNGLVFTAKSESLEEAYKYFAKLKNMKLKQFKKLFIVTEVKN